MCIVFYPVTYLGFEYGRPTCDLQGSGEIRSQGCAKVEQCTTAGKQEIERLRRQSRGAIVESNAGAQLQATHRDVVSYDHRDVQR